MRQIQGQTQRYQASPVPDDAAQLSQYLRSEILSIQSALNSIADGQIDLTTVAPTKPRDGMIRRADGVNWKPNGTGAAGVWCYYSGSWKNLG